jgi:hypothetical protein
VTMPACMAWWRMAWREELAGARPWRMKACDGRLGLRRAGRNRPYRRRARRGGGSGLAVRRPRSREPARTAACPSAASGLVKGFNRVHWRGFRGDDPG